MLHVLVLERAKKSTEKIQATRLPSSDFGVAPLARNRGARRLRSAAVSNPVTERR